MVTAIEEPYVRATVLMGMEKLSDKYGLNLTALMKEVRINPEALKDSSMLISIVAYNRLLNLLEQRSGNPNVGLELSSQTRRALDRIGPLALILKLGDTTGECVEKGLQFLRYHTNGVSVEVIREEGQRVGEFRYTCLRPLFDVRQLTENALGVACIAMRFLTSDDKQRPEKVTFQHRQPSDIQPHEAFFGCPIEFNAPTNSLFFDAALLDQETMGTDDQVAGIVYSYLENEIEKLESELSLASAVAAVIGRLLPSGRCSIDLVAKGVALHPKSLQRRLKEEGTSFSEILEQVRKDTALRLLSETRVPIAQVAGLCGYSNPTAFNNAFNNWAQTTPGKFRKSVR